MLQSMRFSWTKIASMFGVSVLTIYRRRMQFQIPNTAASQQQIDDHQLCEKILHLRQTLPCMGETMVMGHLKAEGYIVTRQRVREVICALDPGQTALRW